MFNTYRPTSINISKEHTVMFNIKRARVEYMFWTYVLFIYWTCVYINIAKTA